MPASVLGKILQGRKSILPRNAAIPSLQEDANINPTRSKWFALELPSSGDDGACKPLDILGISVHHLQHVFLDKEVCGQTYSGETGGQLLEAQQEDMANNHINLAYSLLDQQYWDEAIEETQRALVIREALVDPDHADIEALKGALLEAKEIALQESGERHLKPRGTFSAR